VHNYLLEHVALDASMGYGLRVGRAMAMLHEDHLFDADRAIGELRRLGDRNDSAGLALVEIYRDVKTGHPDEAIATFEQRAGLLRDKLGHRVADAYALVARAYDLIGNDAAAKQAWQRATLLSPTIELTRRYPEVAKTAARFEAAPAPVGM
jgi:tetratricopeptide (TPR) repeat protein